MTLGDILNVRPTTGLSRVKVLTALSWGAVPLASCCCDYGDIEPRAGGKIKARRDVERIEREQAVIGRCPGEIGGNDIG